MRRMIITFMVALQFLHSAAQTISETEAISEFLGSSSEEELDSYEVERLHDFFLRPLKLNLSSASRMLSSGLLTAYQVASLNEYRKKSGDVLSYAELETLDGFGADFVRRLAPFISLESSSVPGVAMHPRGQCFHDLTARSGIKYVRDDAILYNYGLKYRVEVGERLSAAVAASKAYDSLRSRPSAFSGHLAWNFKRHSTKVVLGDYNARFGQGLTFWNGMVLSGLSSPSSYLRRASGISPSWSFTGGTSLTGAAVSSYSGNTGLSMAFALPGMTAANVSWYLPDGQLSATVFSEFSDLLTDDPRIPELKTSVDARFCFSGTDVFSEVAYDWVNQSPAALAGMTFPVSDDFRMASMFRYYPSAYSSSMSGAPRSGAECSNEYSASISGESYGGEYVAINGAQGFGSSVRKYHTVFSMDATYFPKSRSEDMSVTCQFKGLMTWQVMLSGKFRITCRLSERIRNWDEHPFRTDFRTDICFFSHSFTGTLRLNVLNSLSTSFLTYMECGLKRDRLSLYLRQGLFLIDHWEDRIYAYERDAPGNFNVPAYYGRGVWTALTGSWRFAHRGRIYLRAGLTAYPFMRKEKKKPGKAELKLQYVCSF